MSHVQNDWQPTASLQAMRRRAELFKNIRQFFEARGVLEVETPLLCQHTVTDVHIASFSVPCTNQSSYYLQTSPEYAMKRLLAAGSGPIYQLCKAFRNDECGQKHNPEFTLLEWYRPGFSDHELAKEVSDFLQFILHTPPATSVTYAALFQSHLALDIDTCDLFTLQTHAKDHGFSAVTAVREADPLLQFLFSQVIEPTLGLEAPVIVRDFPAAQAALAKLRPHNQRVAERFEVYMQGVELANGFHELTDAAMHRERFSRNQATRQTLAYPVIDMDPRFLASLESGLPPCAGVALGIDRLLMIQMGVDHIDEVINFPWAIA